MRATLLWQTVCSSCKAPHFLQYFDVGKSMHVLFQCGRCYVVGKDVANRAVYVTEGEAGQDHPALLSKTALLHSPHWVAGDAPEQLKNGLPLPCSFKARSVLLSTSFAFPPPSSGPPPTPPCWLQLTALASAIVPGSIIFPPPSLLFILTHIIPFQHYASVQYWQSAFHQTGSNCSDSKTIWL